MSFEKSAIWVSAGDRVRNVTTGASLWLAGAIGLGCGAGQMPLAAMATGLVLTVLFVLRHVERWLPSHE